MNRTAKPSSLLELLELLQDLALHDDVERGRRLVHHDQLGLERERHRDHDALAHAAGELVRVRAHALAVDADELEQVARAGQGLVLRTRSCALNMSTNWSPTRMTGLSTFIALWKTSETWRQRTRRSSSRLMATRSSPRKRMRPPRDLRRRLEDLQHGARQRALATARLAGEPERLDRARARARRRPRHARGGRAAGSRPRGSRAPGAVAWRWRSLVAPLPMNRLLSARRCVYFCRSRGFETSSRPARMKTSATTVIASAKPGKKNGHHSPWSKVELTCAQYIVTPQLVAPCCRARGTRARRRSGSRRRRRARRPPRSG